MPLGFASLAVETGGTLTIVHVELTGHLLQERTSFVQGTNRRPHRIFDAFQKSSGQTLNRVRIARVRTDAAVRNGPVG